jgi:hypothetical protein
VSIQDIIIVTNLDKLDGRPSSSFPIYANGNLHPAVAKMHLQRAHATIEVMIATHGTRDLLDRDLLNPEVASCLLIARFDLIKELKVRCFRPQFREEDIFMGFPKKVLESFDSHHSGVSILDKHNILLS